MYSIAAGLWGVISAILTEGYPFWVWIVVMLFGVFVLSMIRQSGKDWRQIGA